MSRLKQLIHEVHRRSLWQVLGIYVVGGWIALQIVDTLAGALKLPDWAAPLALLLLIIGLPIVLATAFVQDGVGRRDTAAAGEVETTAGGTPIPGTIVGERGRTALFTWRNAVLGGMAAFALWGVGAAGWMIFFGQQGEASGPNPEIALSESRIAVLPFSVRGGEEYAYLHEGLVDLLSTKLDGAGDLKTVDPQALLNAVDVAVDEPIDPEVAQAVARRFGAGRYLTGSVVEAGGRISVRASLYDGDGDAEITAEATAETEAGVFSMVDDLARQLLAGPDAEGSARFTQLAALTTDSLPALKAFLEGTALFRDGAMAEAVAAYERAVSIDTTFALAYYRLSIAHEWWAAGGHVSDMSEAAERAVRFGERLSERDRWLLEARLTWRQADGVTAERLYRDIIVLYPDEVEAWFQLGEVLFHYGPPNGRTARDARGPLERVLELEPDHLAAMIHLIRLDALDRDTATLRVRVERILELSPDHDYADEARALHGFSVGDSVTISRLMSEPVGPLTDLIATDVAVFAHDLDGGLTIAARMADAQQLRADMYLSKGQWQAAVEELEKVDSVSEADAGGTLALGLRAATAFVERPDDEVRALRDRITELAGSLPRQPGSEYVLGLLSARLGDQPAALAYAAELDDLELPPEVAALFGSAARDLALSVRARTAYASGDHRSALEFIRDQKRQVDYNISRWVAELSRAYDRYMVGTILQSQGDYEEALAWYESIEGHSVSDLPFLAPSHLRRAEIYEQLGDPARATLHYAEFMNLWADADSEYQPMVEAARDRLRALMPDSG